MTNKVLTKTKKEKAEPAPLARSIGPFDLLQNEIGRVFDRLGHWTNPMLIQSFSPSLEIAESDETIDIAIELPGMDEKDVEIGVSDDTLWVRGEKRAETREEKKAFRHVERSYGCFERAIALPSGVDASKVRADMDKGVLKIAVPKPIPREVQRIRITTG